MLLQSTQTPASAAWQDLLYKIQKFGAKTSPRGRPSRELTGERYRFNMNEPIITQRTRQLGYRFMFAEAAWILAGDNRLETIAPYAKLISTFSDDGIFMYGAYGPPIRDQLPYALDCLLRDQDTRQSVISIWRPRPGVSRDIPCTLSLQFLIRDAKLHCIATMRSSDAWLGLPYDGFTFTMVAELLRHLYNQKSSNQVGRGAMQINAGSEHLYESNLDGAALAWAEKVETLPKVRLSDDVVLRNPIDEMVRWLWLSANEDAYPLLRGEVEALGS